ncbi:MAG: hypothetical protein IJ859_04505 [Synergistaceae bacterium]|nr:hypothetical protein [Synergistaceae bacterium]MBR2208053.1 hypothetical protein [Synergistaceae bacterium]
MTNSLQIFNYNGAKVRTVIQDGQAWFVAKDVCDVLGLKNSRKAVSELYDNEKDVTISYTPGGKQEMTIVNEPGLYKLIFKSRKPEAKKFQDWVFYDVLPDINKHGMYLSDKLMEQLIDKPAVFREVCANYIESKYPSSDKTSLMVLGYSVRLSQSLFVVKEAANILRKFGLDTGEYKLWRMLRDDGFACRHNDRRHNIPTQKGLDENIIATAFTGKTPLTMMTVNGLQYYAQKLVKRDFPLLAG